MALLKQHSPSSPVFHNSIDFIKKERLMAPAHPLVVKIGFVQFERLFTFLSLQTTFESDWLMVYNKDYSYGKGLGLYMAKRGSVNKRPFFVWLRRHFRQCNKICFQLSNID